jgi:N-acetylmuramoyl-L-alanine amidase
MPNQKYWTANFAMVKNTNCPAVLTENLFMDNKEDVEFLLSEAGRKKIVNLHVKGIVDYINKIK